LKAGDKNTFAKYSHLLSDSDCQSVSSIVWLTFHQVVMRDLLENVTKEEQEAVNTYIKTRLEKAIAVHERPWEAFPGDSEAAKKRNHLSR